jgi:hypothetical protein
MIEMKNQNASLDAQQISLISLKKGFSSKFPTSPLTQILISEPDYVTITELLAKSQTWFSILENKRRNGNE